MASKEYGERLHGWLEGIPLSRRKRHVNDHRGRALDFSDGVLVAEIVAHSFPRLVDLHNYVCASKFDLKQTNWSLLNRKVFKRLGFRMSDQDIVQVCESRPGAINGTLNALQAQMEKIAANNGALPSTAAAGPPRRQPGAPPPPGRPTVLGVARRQRLPASQPSPTRHVHAMMPGGGGGHRLSSNRPGRGNDGAGRRSVDVPLTRLNGQTVRQTVPAPRPSRASHKMETLEPEAEKLAAAAATPSSHANPAVLAEKDRVIEELRTAVGMLQHKMHRLEDLLRLKDQKLASLMQHL
eukprot:TRINITY_DN24464_c0_g1_i1.p1 TRINITY_DN24464_c0_g1~~TRINITY_DN24464_c0_g1_i1.p1  ORF type:complete len:295 (-),score=44.08 TRINITY_DN24464_c0_g1_i1:343-1227(-)